MKVTLIAHTPEPEKVVAAAAKLCYSNSGIDDLLNGLTPEKTRSFLSRLTELGHASPTEHASFTFAIEGVSRTLLAQITRHRHASFSVQSQRYVNLKNFEYVVPAAIAESEVDLAMFEDAMQKAGDAYQALTKSLQAAFTEQYVQQGEARFSAASHAEKTAIENARAVLPGACTTKMIVTMNARSLNHFFALRLCNRAQEEIQELAEQMLALVYPVAPMLFAQAGPSCVSGPCPEGHMSCGKANEVRSRYKELKKNKEDN